MAELSHAEAVERRYTIVLEPDLDDGGYVVTVPALPGCVTQGETVEQCAERAREAISGYIESLIARGLPVPQETEPPRLLEVHVAA
jgi:predicted RNase H-like HicB family nuclease